MKGPSFVLDPNLIQLKPSYLFFLSKGFFHAGHVKLHLLRSCQQGVFLFSFFFFLFVFTTSFIYLFIFVSLLETPQLRGMERPRTCWCMCAVQSSEMHWLFAPVPGVSICSIITNSQRPQGPSPRQGNAPPAASGILPADERASRCLWMDVPSVVARWGTITVVLITPISRAGTMREPRPRCISSLAEVMAPSSSPPALSFWPPFGK